MIPISDNAPSSGRFPIATVILIGLNVAVFLFELALGPMRDSFVAEYGLAPATLWDAVARFDYPLLAGRVVSASFLHGGWLHLGGNMLYLWVFGDNVEDRLGSMRFLLFYALAGALALTAHAAFVPDSEVPVIGASGAIAGILGAYVVLFPRARVSVLIPLLLLFPVIEVPAVLALGFWFVEQLLSGTLAISEQGAGVAWWAHVGGFLSGVFLVGLFLTGRPGYRSTDYGGV